MNEEPSFVDGLAKIIDDFVVEQDGKNNNAAELVYMLVYRATAIAYIHSPDDNEAAVVIQSAVINAKKAVIRFKKSKRKQDE